MMTPKERIDAAEMSLYTNVFGETNIRQMAEAAVARSQRYVEIPARAVANAPIFADDVEGAICAVGVKHGLNIHPAIARDIAAYLRGDLA